MSENRSKKPNSLPSGIQSLLNDRGSEKMNMLWDTLGQADSVLTDVTKSEVEEDLENIHIQLGFATKGDRIAGYIRTYGRYAAAALALIAFGLAFLMLPQTVEVPPGEMATVSLPDGSTVELNSGSVVQFNRLFGFTNRDISLNGEGYFDVASAEIPFEIRSNGAVTEVVGTRFNVRSWSDHPQNETLVAVEEGTVRFFPLTQIENAVQLTESQQSLWRAELDAPTIPSSTDLERISGWRDRKFIFYEESLQQIFREVERRFDVTIDLENRDVVGETLTGYYGEVINPESLLDDICTVAGLQYSRTANGYRVY